MIVHCRYFDSAEGQTHKLSFSLIASLVRLGHNYQIPALREGGLARLKMCFPASDSDHDWRSAGNLEEVRIKLGMNPEDVIVALNLARLTDTSSFLPFALYECCLLDSTHLVFGVKQPDGSLEKLHPDDLKRCIEGREKLLAANKTAVAWLFKESVSPAKNCRSPQTCTQSLGSILKSVSACGKLATYHALDPLLKNLTLDVCKNCLQIIVEKDNTKRRRVWQKLSRYVGLTETGLILPSSVLSHADATYT